MTNLINFLKNARKKLVDFFKSGTTSSYIIIGFLAVLMLAGASIATIFIIANATSDSHDTSQNSNITVAMASESETTTPNNSQETIAQSDHNTNLSTEETTTNITTLPSNTESEDNTTIETTLLTETTKQPETVNVSNLDIKDDSESDETKPNRNESAVKPEAKPTATKPANKPTDNKNTSTTKPTTNKKPSTTKPEEETTTKPATIVTNKPSTEATNKPSSGSGKPYIELPSGQYGCVAKGIDISKWNSQYRAKIDWNKVKESGVSFVIIRAGYRSTSSKSMYKDPYFDEHMKGAQAAGLQVGVYFYSQAITENEALEEASYLLSIIKDYDITYPVCFDWEPTPGTRAKKAKLSKKQVTNIAKKFLSTIEGYGYEAMLYSYHSAFNDYFYMDKLSEYKTWVAYYYPEYDDNGVEYQFGDPVPEETYSYQMWQYTDTGTVPGIEGVVDMNVAFFAYSGSSAPEFGIQFTIPHNTYITNVGVTIDYTTDVIAVDSAGFDITAYVTTSIKDKNGKKISDTEAFNTAGVYTISYTVSDFTGYAKTVTVPLFVQATPTLTLASTELTFKHTETSYKDVLLAVQNNIIDACDFEKNKIPFSNITIDGLNAIYKLPSENEEQSEDNTHDTNKTEQPSQNNDTTELDVSKPTVSDTDVNDKEFSDIDSSDKDSSDTDSSDADSSDADSSDKDSSDIDSSDIDSSSKDFLDTEISSTESTETDTSDQKNPAKTDSTSDTDDNNTSGEDSSLQEYILLTGDFTITYTIVDKYGLTSSCDTIIHILP